MVRSPASHEGKPSHGDERGVFVNARRQAQRPIGRCSEYVQQGLCLGWLEGA